MLNIENLKITRHAIGKMGERGVEVEDLAEALLRPAIVEPHEGKRRFVSRDGLVLVIAGDDEAPVLVTVLLRRRETWNSADARKHFRK